MLHLVLLLFFIAFSNHSFSRDKKKKKNAAAMQDTMRYLVIADTTISGDTFDIHNDTVFNKKYEFKRIITSTDVIADTTFQTDNVYTINFLKIHHYDYIPTDPIYGYNGKIRLAKPYPFFRQSNVLNKPRVWLVSGTVAGLYAVANVWWSTAWYSKYDRTSFHFFNDWGEWNQMDKIGHAFSCYAESKLHYDLYRWAGVKEKHAIWIGMLMGNLWQLSIEINDGFQENWGFSWGDIAMNVSGSLIFGIQQYLWHDQRFVMKFSAFPVNYEKKYNDPEVTERTNALYGTSFTESMLKDYNAQTLWLSVSPGSFIRNPKSKMPKWIQFSFGYGASGMLGGYENKWSKDDLSGDDDLSTADPEDIVDKTDIQRLRRFYFSFDIDWTKLPVKRDWAKGLMKVLNIIKLPAPALEVNNNNSGSKVAWHWLKF